MAVFAESEAFELLVVLICGANHCNVARSAGEELSPHRAIVMLRASAGGLSTMRRLTAIK